MAMATERMELQRRREIDGERYWLDLKTIDGLLDILADEYGMEPPARSWFKSDKKYKQGLIDAIIKLKFGSTK
jgi:hypothetical protein